MAIPTVPVAHFIVVQAGFALGLLNALFDRVASGNHLRQLFKRGVGRRIGQVVGELGRVADSTATNQPGIWSRQAAATFHDPLVGPVVADPPFLAFGHDQSLPAAFRSTGYHVFSRRRRRCASRKTQLRTRATTRLRFWLEQRWALNPHRGRRANGQYTPTAVAGDQIPQFSGVAVTSSLATQRMGTPACQACSSMAMACSGLVWNRTSVSALACVSVDLAAPVRHLMALRELQEHSGHLARHIQEGQVFGVRGDTLQSVDQ
jgi:hypothetical protein